MINVSCKAGKRDRTRPDFGRYHFLPTSQEVIIFPYGMTSSGYELVSESEMRHHSPKAHAYLASRKKELESRKQFKAWHSFSAPRNLEVHDNAQMLVPLLADRGLYCRLPAAPTTFCLMASGGFSITVNSGSNLSPNYVLGLLNSRLLYWRLRSISNVFRGGWITCTKQYVETLPIHISDFSDAVAKARHDRLVSLVEQMLALHKQSVAATTPHAQTMLQTQIAATDRQIDQLVYELYGLTEEEIRIVEGTNEVLQRTDGD
jgi:TaqI-like C-terminal specificity domain